MINVASSIGHCQVKRGMTPMQTQIHAYSRGRKNLVSVKNPLADIRGGNGRG
ncbi:MAG: hypothetical protein LH628_02665 [Microcoleus sp. CAN_BIN18]|nr:hypothetical protein [Microcoleus sp. CAN_BIN18]